MPGKLTREMGEKNCKRERKKMMIGEVTREKAGNVHAGNCRESEMERERTRERRDIVPREDGEIITDLAALGSVQHDLLACPELEAVVARVNGVDARVEFPQIAHALAI